MTGNKLKICFERTKMDFFLVEAAWYWISRLCWIAIKIVIDHRTSDMLRTLKFHEIEYTYIYIYIDWLTNTFKTVLKSLILKFSRNISININHFSKNKKLLKTFVTKWLKPVRDKAALSDQTNIWKQKS